MKTLVIAEAGVNHNGDIALARKLIELAADSGADAIKFQTFKAENVVSRFAPKAEYQTETTRCDETQLEMIQRLQLDEGEFRELRTHALKKHLTFLSSPFDLEGLEILRSLGLRIIKIPSGEITNKPLLQKVGGYGGEVILSTGMSTMSEVGDALQVLTEGGTDISRVTVLHCNTEYPTPIDDVNLRAMLSIRDEYGVKVGYSDHTSGIEVSIAAVALGAKVIEKHFTIDRTMDGPDHRASLEPNEFADMVSAIRNIERAMGDGVKRPSKSELKNLTVVRKCIVASQPIRRGEIISHGNITTKRPAVGVSPMRWDEIVGKRAQRNYYVDEPIQLD